MQEMHQPIGVSKSARLPQTSACAQGYCADGWTRCLAGSSARWQDEKDARPTVAGAKRRRSRVGSNERL